MTDDTDTDTEIDYDELAQSIIDRLQSLGLGRRDMLKILAGGGAGALAMSAASPASAQQINGIIKADQLGTSSEPVKKLYVDEEYGNESYTSISAESASVTNSVDAGSVSTENVNTPQITDPDDGTTYDVGDDLAGSGSGGSSSPKVTTETELLDAESNNPAGTTVAIPSEATISLSANLSLSLKLIGYGTAEINTGTYTLTLADAVAGLEDLAITAHSSAMTDGDATILFAAGATIKNCELDGTATTSDSEGGGYAITGNGNEWTVKDAHIHHWNQSAIDTWHTNNGTPVSNITISDNLIEQTIYEDGIAASGLKDSLIRDNTVRQIGEANKNANACITIGTDNNTSHESSNCRITGNHCEDAGEGILITQDNSNPPTDMIVSNNTIENAAQSPHSNAESGVWLIGEGITFDSNTVDNNGLNKGIHIEGEDITVSNSTIRNWGTGNEQIGIHITQSRTSTIPTDITIQGCRVVNGALGISTRSGSVTTTNVSISYNVVEVSEHNAIDIDGAEDCTAGGNQAETTAGTPYNAVSLFGAQDCIVTANRLNGTGQAGVRLFNGSNGEDALDNIVSENNVSGLDNGVEEVSGEANYNTITSNNLRDCSTPLTTNGTNTISANNQT